MQRKALEYCSILNAILPLKMIFQFFSSLCWNTSLRNFEFYLEFVKWNILVHFDWFVHASIYSIHFPGSFISSWHHINTARLLIHVKAPTRNWFKFKSVQPNFAIKWMCFSQAAVCDVYISVSFIFVGWFPKKERKKQIFSRWKNVNVRVWS